MPKKSRTAQGSGHPQSPSSSGNKKPSPEGRRDGRRKTKRRHDKRPPAKLLSPTSKEGSLLAVDEHFEKPQAPRRHRSPVSGSASGSPRITSPRLTSPRPEPQTSTEVPGASPVSPVERPKLRDLGPSQVLPAEWSGDHGGGSTTPHGSSDAELSRSKKIRRSVAAVILVLTALCVALFLWNRRAFWGAQALKEEHHFCDSIDCVNAMSRTRSSAHESADPCTDFYEYACGRWAPLDSEGLATDYIDELFRNYTNSLFRLLERRDNDTLRWSGSSIAHFYGSCLRYMISPHLAFFNASIRELNLSWAFWRPVASFPDLAILAGWITIRGGMPAVVNVTMRNAVLQMDVGTTLTASLMPFNLTASDVIAFVANYIEHEFHNFRSHLLSLDAEMERERAQFNRSTPFHVVKHKNGSGIMAFLYGLALKHSDSLRSKVITGTVLARGVQHIVNMLEILNNKDPKLCAVYFYMIAASEMLGYEISRLRHYGETRGQASLRCVYAVLAHYHSGFLHWAARLLQSRYVVDSARNITARIKNQFVKMAPANVVNDVRALMNATRFHFYADPGGETYSQAAKINTPYAADNFLHNLVLYARRPVRDRAIWTPFQESDALERTVHVVHDKRLHVVVSPMYLTEDFFYGDALEQSLNMATLGVHVADVVMKAVDRTDAYGVRQWKGKVEACHRSNVHILGWNRGADGEDDFDYGAAMSLAVAYEAGLDKDRTHGERSRFFFQRFALTNCAINASAARRLSVHYAVRYMPEFAKAFGCKPSGFTPCNM